MAEKRDIESANIKDSVESELSGYAKGLVTGDCGKYTSLSGDTRTEFRASEYRYALLPAWIMTYRQRGAEKSQDKTYYYAMNGQNKNICGILPGRHRKAGCSTAHNRGGDNGAAEPRRWFLW